MELTTTVTQGRLTEVNATLKDEDVALKTQVTLRHHVTGQIKRVVVLSAEQADPIEFCRSALATWDQWRFVDAEVVWSACF
jgi:hypothetical protein